MKSKAHGKRCPEGTTPGPVMNEPDAEEGGAYKTIIFHSIIAKKTTKPIKERKEGNSAVLFPVGGAEEGCVAPEDAEEHQFSDAEDTDKEEDDSEDADEETSQSSASSVKISLCSPGPGCQSASNSEASVKNIQTTESSQLSPSRSSYVQTTTATKSSSPICSLSPGLHLSPDCPCPPWLDVSPLHCLSPRLSLSPSPCQSSLSPSTRPVSPFSQRHLSPVQAISPICSTSPSSLQSSSFGTSVTIHHRACRQQDLTKSSTNTVSSKDKLVSFITTCLIWFLLFLLFNQDSIWYSSRQHSWTCTVIL